MKASSQFTLPSMLDPHFLALQVSSTPTPLFSPHFGNGLLSEFPNVSTSSRMRLRLASSFSTSASISPTSPPYHSGGIRFATFHTVSAGMVSRRDIHGSKDSHPLTSR